MNIDMVGKSCPQLASAHKCTQKLIVNVKWYDALIPALGSQTAGFCAHVYAGVQLKPSPVNPRAVSHKHLTKYRV